MLADLGRDGAAVRLDRRSPRKVGDHHRKTTVFCNPWVPAAEVATTLRALADLIESEA